MRYQLHKQENYGVNLCADCLEKQREIDRLREEVQWLKSQLNQRQRKQQEGVSIHLLLRRSSRSRPIARKKIAPRRAGRTRGIRGMGGVPVQRRMRMNCAASSCRIVARIVEVR